MKNDINRQFRLKSRPVGRIKDSDFELVETPIPVAQDGEAVVRNLYLSLDPTNRIWMSDIDQYMPPVEIGAVMRGGGIGQVWRPGLPATKLAISWPASSTGRTTRSRAPTTRCLCAHCRRDCRFRCRP
jgi:NADPH-dependent curcumin reductase CurA